MLPSKNRLSKEDFNTIKSGERGVFYNTNHLSFTVYKNKKEDDVSRFSCLVSKKVAKNAVVRNKIRRQVYTSVSDNLINIKNGFYCVFVSKVGLDKIKTIEMKEIVVGLLKQANILI